LVRIKEVKNFLEKFYSDYGITKTSFNKIFLGLSEAVNNAIIHGNKLNAEKKVFIKVQLFNNQIWMEVEDEGEGFCVEKLPDPTAPENIKLENGRGIFLMKFIANELAFKNNGRKVQIKFNIDE
jgi:serine/threonine-protein kinase RsbW